MDVSCWNTECKYIENGYCSLNFLTINEDGECDDYESCYDSAEWQVPFWKRCIDKENNRIIRVQAKGKEIDIYGRKFFVESNSAFATTTDKITGMGAANAQYLLDRFVNKEAMEEKFNEMTKDLPPLETLPVAAYDEKTRKFIYEDEVSDNG